VYEYIYLRRYIFFSEKLYTYTLCEMATNYNLMEVPCQKAVSGDSFGSGVQDYVFTVGRPNCVNMARSYFKVDLAVEDATDGTSVQVSDLIALADNCVGNLYTGCQFRGGGQDMGTINSFPAQASQLKKRLGKTGAWLNSMGKGSQYNSASKATRIQALSNRALQTNESPDCQVFYKAGSAVATVELKADGTGTGVGTTFVASGVKAGDILVVEGTPFTVVSATGPLALTVHNPPAVDMVASTNYYFIRRNVANTDLGKNIVSILWQPPLGIFDNDDLLGAGDYRISLTPDANYRITGVETDNELYNVGNGTKLIVKDVKLYIYQAKATIPEGVRDLGLTEMWLNSKPIVSGGSNSLQFSVPPSTMYLTVFVQSNLVGANTNWPPSLFKTAQDPNLPSIGQQTGDTTLNSLQISYASINKPSTRWSSEFKSVDDEDNKANTSVNKLTQRYFDSFLEMNNMSNSSGGTETFGEWCQRGPFYHFVFARDMSDRATEVQLNIDFRSVAPNTQCFLCAWYHQTVRFTVSEGMITSVSSRQI